MHGIAFGRLVAKGAMPWQRAHGTMAAHAAAEFRGAGDAGADAAEALADGVAWWTADRDRTRFAIRRALVPLLARRLSSSALLSAAHAVNDRRGGPLGPVEVVHAVRFEVARTLTGARAVPQ